MRKVLLYFDPTSCGVFEKLNSSYGRHPRLEMFLSWFDLAHHDPEPSVEGSGVQSERLPPGFPLKACGNDGLQEGANSTQQAARNLTRLDLKKVGRFVRKGHVHVA